MFLLHLSGQFLYLYYIYIFYTHHIYLFIDSLTLNLRELTKKANFHVQSPTRCYNGLPTNESKAKQNQKTWAHLWLMPYDELLFVPYYDLYNMLIYGLCHMMVNDLWWVIICDDFCYMMMVTLLACSVMSSVNKAEGSNTTLIVIKRKASTKFKN